MDPFSMALISGGVQAVGGILGGLMAGQQASAADRLIKEQMYRLRNIPLPDIEKMKLVLELPEVQGILKPFKEQAVKMGPSKFENLVANQGLIQKQKQGLGVLEQMAQEGITAEDKAVLGEMRDRTAQDRMAALESIRQQMAARGAMDSGLAAQQQMSMLQGSANAEARQADRLAAMKQQGRRDAAMRMGQMAGQMAQEDFNRGATRAQNLDAHQRFAAQLYSGYNQRAADRAMQADTYNLTNKQNTANQRTALRNQQQMHNRQLLQQQFNNQLAKEQAAFAGTQAMANQANQQAALTGNMWGNVMQGVGNVAAGYMMSPVHKPTYGGGFTADDLYDFSPDEMSNYLDTHYPTHNKIGK